MDSQSSGPITAAASTLPLDEIDVSRPELYHTNTWIPFFERLRRDDPVHYNSKSAYGPYWSITRYRDISDILLNHRTFSSSEKYGGVAIRDVPKGSDRIVLSMDPPGHTHHRRDLNPALRATAVRKMARQIRRHTVDVLDSLPRNETIDWVDWVADELHARVMATLLPFPFEDRRKLISWADIVDDDLNAPDALVVSEKERAKELSLLLDYLDEAWEEHADDDVSSGLIPAIAQGATTGDMPGHQRLATIMMFLVGSSPARTLISSGVWGLSEHPEQRERLRQDPALIDPLVSELLRWHTPVIHMRRTAVADAEIRGKRIAKGDKVVLWHISGNRDEDIFEEPNRLIIDRPNGRQHLAFGFGIHRCMGMHLAMLMARTLWEEIVRRDLLVVALEPPTFRYSNLFRAIRALPVRVAA